MLKQKYWHSSDKKTESIRSRIQSQNEEWGKYDPSSREKQSTEINPDMTQILALDFKATIKTIIVEKWGKEKICS